MSSHAGMCLLCVRSLTYLLIDCFADVGSERRPDSRSDWRAKQRSGHVSNCAADTESNPTLLRAQRYGMRTPYAYDSHMPTVQRPRRGRDPTMDDFNLRSKPDTTTTAVRRCGNTVGELDDAQTPLCVCVL